MKLTTILATSLLLLTCSSANSKNTISGDSILAIPATNSLGAKVLVWKYNGTLIYLDAALKAIKTTKLPVNSISDITPYNAGLLVSASKTAQDGIVTPYIMDVSNEGVVRSTWSGTTNLYWSVSYDNGKYLATTGSGELLELQANNTTKIVGHYPETPIYISVPQQEAILCISPNLTKLNARPAKCLRKGSQPWEAVGEWGDTLKPFLCANYLIEATGNWRDAKTTNIQVRDIQTGKIITTKPLMKLETASCVGSKVLIIDNKIHIAKLPGLEIEKTSTCGSPAPRAATLLDDKIICLDKNGKLHTE